MLTILRQVEFIISSYYIIKANIRGCFLFSKNDVFNKPVPSKLGINNAKHSSVRQLARQYPYDSVPSYLHHYTDLQGFVGILKGKGFWLSDAKYLNDAEEIVNGVNKGILVINEMLGYKRYSHFFDVLERLKISLENQVKSLSIYVASFSLMSDSLDQWRSYGDKGNGIQITFDTSIKTNYPHFEIPPQYELMKVIYDDLDKNRIIKLILRYFALYYKKDIANPKFNKEKVTESYVNSIVARLFLYFSIFKNNGYSSEREVRIVDIGLNMSFYKKVDHRISNGLIVPYVSTGQSNLLKEGDYLEIDLLPVKKVILGPVASKNEVKSSVERFLRDLGYSGDVEVEYSKVPFRG